MEHDPGPGAQRRVDGRALLDVGLLLAFGFLVASQLPRLLGRAFRVESDALIALVTQGSFIVVIWGLLAWRGHGFSHIGLERPKDFRRSLLAALALMAALLLLSLGTEALGLRRDLSAFDALKGDLAFTLFSMVFYGLLSAGCYEEILFRGYLMHRGADIFRRTRFGWALAVVLQAAVFGFAHLHQGLYGAFYTGAVAALVGAVYLAGIRNLWVLILAHGLYDALRMLYFHLLLTYGKLETLAG